MVFWQYESSAQVTEMGKRTESAQKALTGQSDQKNYQGLPEMSHDENPSFVPSQRENVQPVGTP
jgi:hypothetical protein